MPGNPTANDTTPHPFDRDTALRPTGPASFAGAISRNWWVLRGPNGGYLAAMILKALAQTVGDPARAPRSLTIHYLLPPTEGPIQIETMVERAGRALSTLSARVLQNQRPVALALAAFSPAWPGPELVDARRPEVIPPEQAPTRDRTSLSLPAPPFISHYDVRWALGDLPFSGGTRSVSGGWMRLAEPRLADAPLVAAFTDAWVPVIYPRLTGPIGTATIDLTIHFRRPLPLPEAQPDDYYLVLFHSQRTQDGFYDENGEIWTRDGELIAQARQLALILPAR